jgi:hypothetical protein
MGREEGPAAEALDFPCGLAGSVIMGVPRQCRVHAGVGQRDGDGSADSESSAVSTARRGSKVMQGSIVVNRTGKQTTSGSAFTPSSFYSYTLDSAASVPSLLKTYAGPQSTIGNWPPPPGGEQPPGGARPGTNGDSAEPPLTRLPITATLHPLWLGPFSEPT